MFVYLWNYLFTYLFACLYFTYSFISLFIHLLVIQLFMRVVCVMTSYDVCNPIRKDQFRRRPQTVCREERAQ